MRQTLFHFNIGKYEFGMYRNFKTWYFYNGYIREFMWWYIYHDKSVKSVQSVVNHKEQQIKEWQKELDEL